MSKQALKRVRRKLGMEVCRKPLDAFAWPGGYPMFYLDGNNSILCADCASESCSDDIPKFRPVACDVHWEGDPLTCEHCNTDIESAYGPLDEYRPNIGYGFSWTGELDQLEDGPDTEVIGESDISRAVFVGLIHIDGSECSMFSVGTDRFIAQLSLGCQV